MSTAGPMEGVQALVAMAVPPALQTLLGKCYFQRPLLLKWELSVQGSVLNPQPLGPWGLCLSSFRPEPLLGAAWSIARPSWLWAFFIPLPSAHVSWFNPEASL